MALPAAVALRSGDLLPRIGLGVYKALPSETEAAVASALRLGYRHVDTAQVYGNEAEVGRAVAAFEAEHAAAGTRVFVTTKVWKSAWGFDKCRSAVKLSLQKLGHIDLVLLHAPGDAALRAETWRGLEACLAEGLVAAIGVSNFGIPHLEKLAKTAVTPPAVNQVEVHPFLQRRELCAYCAAHGIVVEAYSPLGKGHVLQDATVCGVAQELGVSAAQVLLRWSLQKGNVALPKSVHPERQAGNLDVFRFSLSDAQMATLDGLERAYVTGWDPITQDEV